MKSCRECGDRGSILIIGEEPAPDSISPPKFDDLPEQPARERIPPTRWDLCNCVVAPGFADWIEI